MILKKKLRQYRASALCSLALVGFLSHPAGVSASAVFDGSVGGNASGTTRAGDFVIGQGDGAVAGNNLFHSFERFGVDAGESATFTHSAAEINHIIARVTGTLPTEIFGSMQVRRATGGSLVPTAASLWLLNPNGIFIGDGASFDAQSSFVFSTANRLGFSNGDSFYSHDLAEASILSIADPSAFGFLDRQGLPDAVIPRGIVVAVSDPADLNAPLFLSDITLVGSSLDTEIARVTVYKVSFMVISV